MRTRIIAKTIVFNDHGKLLVLWRSTSDSHRPGGSDFPGGGVEGGEDVAVGAVRELAEETGIRIGREDIALTFTTTKVDYHTEERAEVNMVWLGFVAKFPAGQKIELSFEHNRYDWLTLEEAAAGCDSVTQKQFMEYLRDHDVVKDILQ